MRALILCMILVGCLMSRTHARGYIFNRFRPDSTKYVYGNGLSDRWTPREHLLQSLLGEEFLQEEMCSGRRCSSNDHCCSGHICVSFDSESGGTCLAAESHRKTYECVSNLDCDDGQICELGLCAHQGEKKGYNEPCGQSIECDINEGLCCQVIRRHRQSPRKICAYYKDPLSCLGHLDVLPSKRIIPAH